MLSMKDDTNSDLDIDTQERIQFDVYVDDIIIGQICLLLF